MANIFDYLAWRGDVDFGYSPFNEVDGMILSRLSYLPFDGVVGESFEDSLPLGTAAERLLEQPDASDRMRMQQDAEFLEKLAGCRRFSGIRLCGFKNRFNEKEEEQFCAVSCRLPEFTVASFRGTDGTLIGWKEDFNMAFSSPVPAQRSAAEYLDALAGKVPGALRACGHSKGGNLAVYAAAFCAYRNRIDAVYNYDGPGFVEEILKRPGFAEAVPKLRNFIPQTSVIGMLLDHGGDYTVVRSVNTGIMQHDLYSWEVYGPRFVTLETVTSASRIIDNTVTQWLGNLTAQERERFVDALFSLLMETGAKRLSDITGNIPRSMKIIYSSLKEMDPETSKLLEKFLGSLIRTAGHNLKAGLLGGDSQDIAEAKQTAD